jgi:hypothetical protein
MHDSVKKRVDVCSHSITAVGADGNVIVAEQFLSYLCPCVGHGRETINNHIVVCNQTYDPYRAINRITIYEIKFVGHILATSATRRKFGICLIVMEMRL